MENLTPTQQTRQTLYEALCNTYFLFVETEPFPDFYDLEDDDIRQAFKKFLRQLSDEQVQTVEILYDNEYFDGEKTIPYLQEIPRKLLPILEREIDEIFKRNQYHADQETQIRKEWEQYPRGWGD
jgi:hypothetical protein